MQHFDAGDEEKHTTLREEDRAVPSGTDDDETVHCMSAIPEINHPPYQGDRRTTVPTGRAGPARELQEEHHQWFSSAADVSTSPIRPGIPANNIMVINLFTPGAINAAHRAHLGRSDLSAMERHVRVNPEQARNEVVLSALQEALELTDQRNLGVLGTCSRVNKVSFPRNRL